MSSKLAGLLASPAAARSERTVEVCLAQAVPAKIVALTREKADLEFQIAQMGDGEEADGQAQRKMGAGGEQVARLAEVKAEIEGLNDVMREHTGNLTVAATISQGEWRRWAEANPAREDGRDKNGRVVLSEYDVAVVGGYCNATALLARLGDFATAWDGEALSAGQWEALADKAAPGDLKAAARAVVTIYEGEGVKALPKSLSASSGTESSGTN